MLHSKLGYLIVSDFIDARIVLNQIEQSADQVTNYLRTYVSNSAFSVYRVIDQIRVLVMNGWNKIKSNIDDSLAKTLDSVFTTLFSELTTFSYGDSKDLSQFLESSSEEYIGYKFNNSSLNIILTESFEIKSSYKNCNELSKGDIINNSRYKIFIENILKIKSNIFNDHDLEPFIFEISEKCKKYRKLGEDLMNYSPGKSKSNKDIFCKTQNSSNQLINMNKQNQILFKNINEKLIKNKNTSKLEIDKFDKLKLIELKKIKTEHQSENNEEKLTIDIDNTKPNIYKKAKKSKNSFKLKNIEIPAKSNVINIIGDKSFSSSKNNFKDFDKEDSSKINKLHLLNAKKNINSAFVNNNYDVENKREKNCIAF